MATILTIRQKNKPTCDFEAHNELDKVKLETPVCKGCGAKHPIEEIEFDSTNIKENIRVIDSNRDYLLARIEFLTRDLLIAWQEDHKRREKVKAGLSEARKAVGEMNQAVREICKENAIYQVHKFNKGGQSDPPKH